MPRARVVIPELEEKVVTGKKKLSVMQKEPHCIH